VVTPTHHEESHISEPRINDRIRVAEVRLVGPNGEQVGIVRVEDALRLAQEADLDLVEVAPDARPPVCKLMDFGKFKYEADMKAREARRNQANTVLKEIRFRLKIDPHDYGTKKGHVERFLKAGDKVKIMIMFRGREQSRPEMGVRLLQRLADDVVELGFIESMPKQDGRNMIMVLGPTKKKADAKNELRRKAQETEAPADVTTRPAAAPATAAPAGPAPAAPAPAVAARDVEVPAVEVPTEPAPVEAAPAPVEAAPAPVEVPAVEVAPAVPAQPAPAPAAPAKVPARPPAPRPTSAAPAAAASHAAPRPATPKPVTPKPATPKPAAAATPRPAARPAPSTRPAKPASPVEP